MYKQLTSEQRYTISVLWQRKCTKKSIAEAVGVSFSTITRELRRNSDPHGVYIWDKAHKKARKRKRRDPGNRSVKPEVRKMATDLLRKEQWSPEQISGYLAMRGIRISHETIYGIIREDRRRGGKLYTFCRHRLKHRHRTLGKKFRIPGRISIHERPQEADGKRFGDFEMDTIVGRDHKGAILTIVERSTNMLFMKKLRYGKDPRELAKAVVELLRPYKKHIKTITTDNGMEFYAHADIARQLNTKVYFTDPYASWQKGAIENANGLIRQYIQKSSSFKSVTDYRIMAIMDRINERPRKKLNFLTPKECFLKLIT